MTLNKFTYNENKASKKLLFECVGGLHFYVAEGYDEDYLIKKYVKKSTAPKVFILKDARGRLLSKIETH